MLEKCLNYHNIAQKGCNSIHTWNWGGWRGVANPPKTQKSQKATPPETPLKSSGIATTLKPNSNPPKNFRDRPPYA